MAEIQDLRADPTGRGRGVVLEAHLDKGRGPVATMIVMRGTLRVGDSVVSGGAFAKVRAMFDEHGALVEEAGPSRPVLVLGWNHIPEAGDEFRVVEDEREARHAAQHREARQRAADLVDTRPGFEPGRSPHPGPRGRASALNLDHQGRRPGFARGHPRGPGQVPAGRGPDQVIHKGVGGISENDVSLALASEAIVIGFNVRPDVGARELAEKEGVDLRLYQVIYQMLDDIRQALTGMLSPEEREADLGRAEVRALFRVPKLGVIAGMHGHARADHARCVGPAGARRRHRVHGPDRVAAPIQG